MGRTSVITITLFVFLVLGNMALIVLSGANAVSHHALSRFLAHEGWWLLVLPAVWALFANVAGRINRGILTLPVAHGLGCLLGAGLLVVYGLAIFSG